MVKKRAKPNIGRSSILSMVSKGSVVVRVKEIADEAGWQLARTIWTVATRGGPHTYGGCRPHELTASVKGASD